MLKSGTRMSYITCLQEGGGMGRVGGAREGGRRVDGGAAGFVSHFSGLQPSQPTPAQRSSTLYTPKSAPQQPAHPKLVVSGTATAASSACGTGAHATASPASRDGKARRTTVGAQAGGASASMRACPRCTVCGEKARSGRARAWSYATGMSAGGAQAECRPRAVGCAPAGTHVACRLHAAAAAAAEPTAKHAPARLSQGVLPAD